MKKLLIVCACTILVAGCSNKPVHTQVEPNVIATLNDQSINNNDLFQSMVHSGDVFNSTMTDVLNQIGSLELDEEAINDKVNTVLKSYQDAYGKEFETQVINAGLISIENFKQTALRPDAITELLLEKFLTDQKEELNKTYKFRSVRLLMLDSEEDANATLSAINGGEGKWENFVTDTNAFDLSLVYKGFTKTEIPEHVFDEILAQKEVGLSTKAIKANSKFFIFEVLDMGSEELDKTISINASTIPSISNDSILHFFNKYNVVFHDQRLQDSFNAKYKK